MGGQGWGGKNGGTGMGGAKGGGRLRRNRGACAIIVFLEYMRLLQPMLRRGTLLTASLLSDPLSPRTTGSRSGLTQACGPTPACFPAASLSTPPLVPPATTGCTAGRLHPGIPTLHWCPPPLRTGRSAAPRGRCSSRPRWLQVRGLGAGGGEEGEGVGNS